MLSWKIEKRLIKDLKPHPSNPRELSKFDRDHIKASLMKFGVIDKIVINTDNTIIGGHQRCRILKEMGEKEVDCYTPSRGLSEEEVKELLLRLNKNQGEFDYDMLANNFNPLDLLSWGFSIEELELDSGKPKKEKKKKQCPHCGGEI